jgi:hypothetical protein
MTLSNTKKKARIIPFYLPQFHPIPENDEWWGKGFTEWTNTAKAKPMFRGHHQPNLPADLGFYDLRNPETRIDQAELAREHGIEGFCYWHYWFSGKQILERPFQEVLESGIPDFPFCLAWANHNWSGIWHGAPGKILLKQTYGGKKDYESHFYSLLDAFTDPRYIKVENKPLFIVYRSHEFPEVEQFISLWQELAIKEGLEGLYIPGFSTEPDSLLELGFDACIYDMLPIIFNPLRDESGVSQWIRKARNKPIVYPYKKVVQKNFMANNGQITQYPFLFPNWDNTPRSGTGGIVLSDSTPELFRYHVKKILQQVRHREPDKRLVFVKSWNEWAEGNYLEPDMKYNRRYLEVIKEEITCT